jgi:hypothetical protein
MNMWQNIFSHPQIFCPMCQRIFSTYFVNINKIFQKDSFKLTHTHRLLMLAHSRNNILTLALTTCIV